MLIFSLVSTMLTEFMPKRAASGIALNNFVRNICSFTGAMIAEPIYYQLLRMYKISEVIVRAHDV